MNLNSFDKLMEDSKQRVGDIINIIKKNKEHNLEQINKFESDLKQLD